MATPVDSSFSSQSDDFANFNDSDMSESLIFCLNGNEPIEYATLPTVDIETTANCSTISRATSRPFSSIKENISYQRNNITIKRPLMDDESSTDLLKDQLYSCINPKKNHLELDETAL